MVAQILYVVILIGVLVFVHEFGHFLVAKLCNVKVLSFSIGFGPRLFGFKRGETDWVVRLLPLGGYVQMLGSDPFDEVPVEDKERAFGSKPLWQRSLVILAGPAANLLLPIPILFFVLFGSYESDHAPVVGQVIAERPAYGALEVGDEITAIDGEEVRYWNQLVAIVQDAAGEDLEFTILRDGEEKRVDITPVATTMRDAADLFSPTVGVIGIARDQYASIVGITDPTGPAARDGLRTFDEVMMVNGEPVSSFTDLRAHLLANGAKPAEFVILREQPLNIAYGKLAMLEPLTVRVTPEMRDGKPYFGVGSAEMFIAQVDPGTPAAEAGLHVGDEILELDGKPIDYFGKLTTDLMNAWEDPHLLKVRRGTEELELSIQLRKLTVVGEYKEERPVLLHGMYNQPRRVMPELRDVPFGDRLAYASSTSIRMTVQASTALVVVLYRMAEGRVSTKSVGGPIMISHMAAKAGEAGVQNFLQMLAIISINLGIVNLLPIPVLDGGHLLLFAMEGIKRGPLSVRTRQIASFVGLAIVIFLMLFAFKNDFERYWDTIF